ncbi:spore coat protein JB [Desulfohalotomaculum tongense]|uniref:spore coat protein CotJB n=1 Tax=Desulforadius tongensis TaxID=1216062 RepID=UPI0019572A21|nr:spore coat protein CotJB [Desulforadius tongensis]MBM7855648.1 spore coat protein JB [Desulforadius tongensis]
MHMRCKELLSELMEWSFVQLELGLYLDTHPEDLEAYNDYINACDKVNHLKREYEAYCGALSVCGYTPVQYPWGWIETPWPWEIEY